MTLTTETPIILYGAAHRGWWFWERLTKRSCNVVAFIDKRADEIKKHKGLSVYNISAEELKAYYECAVVVVCVANIFEHERIVQDLVRQGFRYIIFCPVDDSVNIYRDDKERREMAELYEALAEDYDIKLPINIPESDGMFEPQIGFNMIICEREERIIASIPTPFAYSRVSMDKTDQHENCILSRFQIVELFDYFAGTQDADPSSYIAINCIYGAPGKGIKVTQEWIENVLLSRKEVFEQICLNDSLNPGFSLDQAVNADWNEKGFYFNMVSGKHRAAFLIHKNKTFIPLALTREDYNKYLNDEVAQHLLQYILDNKMNELPYPLYHPYFVKRYSNPYNYHFILLQRFVIAFFKTMYILTGNAELRNISVFSELPELEPIVQMLSKIGMNVNCVYKPSEFDLIVRHLYYLPDMDIETCDYDLVLSDSVNCRTSAHGLYVIYTDEEEIKKLESNTRYSVIYSNHFKRKVFLFYQKINPENSIDLTCKTVYGEKRIVD